MNLCNILTPFFVYSFIYYGIKKVISTESGTGTVNKDLLKVVTLDDDGRLSENDSSNYDFALKGLLKNQPEYNFKSGSKCVGVKYNDAEVWVHDSTKNQKHPTSVRMDPVAQTLWVQLDTFEFYTFHFSDGKWKFNDQVSEGSCKTYNENLTLSNVVETLKAAPTTAEEPKPEEPEPSTPSTTEEVDEQKNYVEAKYGENIFKFELEKEGQLPESVVVNLLGNKYEFVTNRLDELLFNYSEGIQPLKPDQDIRIPLHYTRGDEHYVFKESEHRWIKLTESDYEEFLENKDKPEYLTSELSEPPEDEYIDLDLNCTKSEYYEYSTHDGRTIFKTKKGYLFKKITSNGQPLWNSHENEYSNKVEFQYEPNGQLFLCVHLVYGDKIVFLR